MKKYFVTFASSNMKNALKRIHSQAVSMNVYDEYRIFDETKLEKSFKTKYKDQLKIHIRGYGYWCWKPQVLTQVLNEAKDGDIIHYIDAGCHLNPQGINRLIEYFDMCIKSESGLLTFQASIHAKTKLIYDGRELLDLSDYRWTKGDLFDYFKCRENQKITHTQTITAGVILLRKCQSSVELINQWANVINTNFKYIDDSTSSSPNFDGFIEHRHDQSIFSILCKLNNVDSVSAYEYWYPKKTSSEADWEALATFPVHAKRDKAVSFLNKVKRKIYRYFLKK